MQKYNKKNCSINREKYARVIIYITNISQFKNKYNQMCILYRKSQLRSSPKVFSIQFYMCEMWCVSFPM